MNYHIRMIFVLIIVFIIEIYIYQGIRNISENPVIRISYLGITAVFYAIGFYLLYNFNDRNFSILISLVMIFVVPKVLGGIVLLMDDIFRLGKFAVGVFSSEQKYYPDRRKFMSMLALGASAVFSGIIVDGMLFGMYRHRVRKIRLKIKNLPKSFKGYKIIQISDVHSGSFSEPEKLRQAINLINEQSPDLVLFTGDMVNTYADEFKPFIPLFSDIRAKDGKYSVLGNHDYGLYGQWENIDDRLQNVPKLISYQKAAGFDMLRNEHRIIEKNGEKIYLLGVENWGELPFPQYGDLDKALYGVPNDAVKILMSHDPTHFDSVVKGHPANVQLTLSGHTHGMQFGIDLKNIKWSPVQYRYKKWADLYESMGKYLYVNRGFGVIGFHGRVGIYPEITLIELE